MSSLAPSLAAGKYATTRRPWLTVLFLLLLQLPLAGWLAPGNGLDAQIVREAVYWLSAGLVLVYVLGVERRGPASIGLRWPRWRSLWIGIAAALLMIAGMALIYLVIYPAFGLADATHPATLDSEPHALAVLIVLRAAVHEEIVYRGFAIERLGELTGRRWLAAAISWLAFTYAHLGYWGWAHLLVAGFGGAVLTGLYLWRRDLAANMIAHFGTDAVGSLLGAL